MPAAKHDRLWNCNNTCPCWSASQERPKNIHEAVPLKNRVVEKNTSSLIHLFSLLPAHSSKLLLPFLTIFHSALSDFLWHFGGHCFNVIACWGASTYTGSEVVTLHLQLHLSSFIWIVNKLLGIHHRVFFLFIHLIVSLPLRMGPMEVFCLHGKQKLCVYLRFSCKCNIIRPIGNFCGAEYVCWQRSMLYNSDFCLFILQHILDHYVMMGVQYIYTFLNQMACIMCRCTIHTKAMDKHIDSNKQYSWIR